MAIWDVFRRESAVDRLLEEQLYAQVVSDLRNGVRRDGLWAKALVSANGDEARARPIYIKLCVQAIRDEAEVLHTISTLNNADSPQERSPSRSQSPKDVYGEDGLTPLMRAARDGDLQRVRELLNLGADPKLTDGSFGTSRPVDFAIRAASRDPTGTQWREIIKALGQ